MSDYYNAQKQSLANKVQNQLIQENELKLAELARVRDEEARARDIQTRAANEQVEPMPLPAQNQYPGQEGMPSLTDGNMPLESRGLISQAELTGFGGMSTPQEGPVGMQPQEGLMGLGGMQAMEMPAQENMSTALDKTEVAYEQAQSRVDQTKQIVNEMRKAGLHDQADAYQMKTYKLQEEADRVKKLHLEAAEKSLDYIGGQANGYLESIKDPNVNKDAAWQRLKLRLQMDGFDTAELDAIPPNQRAAYAEQARSSAISSKDQISLQKTLLAEAGKQDRSKRTEALRDRFQTDKLREQALNRNYKERRFDFAQKKQDFAEKKAEYEVLHGGIKTNLDLAKTQLDEVDKTIKDYTTRKLELDKGNLYYDTKGNAISSDDEEVRAQESKFLNDQIALLTGRKDDLVNSVKDLGDEQSELEKTFAGFQKEPGEKAKPKAAAGKFVYTSKADATSRKNYEAFMAQSKSIQDPAERSRVQAAAQQRMLDNGYIQSK